MKVLGYIRVSSDKQDLQKQKHLLLDHAQKLQIVISEFIEIEISSRKDKEARRINELNEILDKDDVLMVAELSRVGRNMIETLNIIHSLTERGVQVIFVRQPELSTYGNSNHGKLLLAIYSYFAEAEREFISVRTKQGLEAAKAAGKVLGRPKGSKNKKGMLLDPYKDQILEYSQMGLSISAIQKIVNHQMEKPVSYNSFKNYLNKLV